MDVRFSPIKQVQPTTENGVALNYAPAKRVAYRMRWYIILTLALSPVGLFVLWLYFSWVTVSSAGVISMTPQKLVSPGEGIVEQIYVNIGDAVYRDTALIRIRTPILDAEINELERELKVLEAAKNKRPEALGRVLKNKALAAADNYENMQAVLAEYSSLHKQRIIDSDLLAKVKQLAFQARLWQKDAEAEMYRSQYELEKQQVVGSEANQIRSLMHQLVKLKAKRNLYIIRSTDTAQVNDISSSVGDIVAQGQELMYLSARSEAKVFAYLEPKFIDFTQLNSIVEVVFPNGYSSQAYISQPVTLIRGLPSRLAAPFENDRPVLKVTLSFQQALPDNLRIEGLPVEIKHGNIVIDNPKYIPKDALSGLFN